MKAHDRTTLLQRTLAIVGATGTLAFMALPALAQAVPTQGVVNNGDTVSSPLSNPSPNTTSDRCASSVNGGMGGPIDSQSATGMSSSNVNRFPNPNSIAGQQPLNQNRIGSTTDRPGMQTSTNQPRYQFDANNRSAAVAYRANGPAGTSGQESLRNLEAAEEARISYPTAYNLALPSASLPVECAPR